MTYDKEKKIQIARKAIDMLKAATNGPEFVQAIDLITYDDDFDWEGVPHDLYEEYDRLCDEGMIKFA